MQHNTDDNSPLFRPEVTAALSQQWMGAIRLAQPISGWLIAGVAALVAIALVSFVSLGAMTKKARVTGITIPITGSISIAAPSSGLLMHSHVKEGDVVHAGQVLFELSNERQGEKGEITALVAQQLATRQQSLESEQRLRHVQAQDKQQALNLRLNNLTNEAAQLEQEITLLQRRHTLAQESVTKYQTLQTNGYVSAAQTQQKQEDLIDIATRLSTLKRASLQQQANKLAIAAELQQVANNLATDQVQLERALASLQQEMAENRNRKMSLITANQTGTITAMSAQVGQIINGGQVLATLIPSDANKNEGEQLSQLEAHLYAPSRTTGFVAKGQKVLIRYAAFPYQKFGLQQGTVIDVSSTPFAPNELPPNLATTILSNAQQNIQGFNSNEALYRIKVKLDQQSILAYGTAQHLKSGMTLEADVVQDRRKIWEWILEPVLAVAYR
ncbi:MAG: HlyD family efflux transporter periplasmic adaptor subunit [Burkholderiales bacterium]|nr:HlyD family efflux transporter periplasmic adaptor subunit [Burkholderiales bacterium]